MQNINYGLQGEGAGGKCDSSYEERIYIFLQMVHEDPHFLLKYIFH